MMENTKKPAIRFKGYTEAWEQRKLGEMYDRVSEKNDLSYTKEQIISVANMYFKPDSYITDEEYLRTYNVFLLGDIAFEGNKSKNYAHGRFVENTIGNGIVSHVFDVFRPKIDFDLLYWKYAINNERIMGDLLVRCTKASTMMTNLVAADFLKESLLVPSVEEQKKIGQYLTQLDNLITLHQRKCDRLQNVKKSMLEKMFPKSGSKFPEIRFKGFTEAWEQRKLGDVGTTYTGLSGKTKEDFGHGNGQFVTYMNVFSNSVAASAMTEPVEIDDRQNKVLAGDVLFTTSSETPEEVGMSSVWLENSENTYLNSFCFGYRPSIPFDPYYLAYMLRSSSMRKKIAFLAQGISRYNISKNKMMDIEIPVPTMSEQQQVGGYFRNLDNLITLHQRKLEKLKNIKKSMLEKMFV